MCSTTHGEHVFARHLFAFIKLLLNLARWHPFLRKLPFVQINGENPGLLRGDRVSHAKIHKAVGKRPERSEHRFHDEGRQLRGVYLLEFLLEYLFERTFRTPLEPLPRFKGVSPTDANFALLSLPDTRRDQSPRPHKRYDDPPGCHGVPE